MESVKKNAPGKSPLAPGKPVGRPAVVLYSGYPAEYERDAALVGRNKWRTFQNILLNTSIVSAGVRYFLELVGSTEWSVVPSDETSAEAIDLAAEVDTALRKMDRTWTRIVTRAATYRFYGYSWQVWTAKRGGERKWTLKDVAPRPAVTIERWHQDDHGIVFGCWQHHDDAHGATYLPAARSIYIVDDSLSDSPEGCGLLRQVVEHDRRLQRYLQLEGWGYEHDLAGMPIARYPQSLLEETSAGSHGKIDEAQLAAHRKPFEDFIKYHAKSPRLGMVLDSAPYSSVDADGKTTFSSTPLYDIDVVRSSQGESLKQQGAAVQRVLREIAIILGVQGLLHGEQGTGSLALSKDSTSNLYARISGTLNTVAEEFTRQLVPWYLRLNGIDERIAPIIKASSLDKASVNDMTEALASLATAGAVLAPDDPAIGRVRDVLGLPRHEVDEGFEDGEEDGEIDDAAEID